MLAAAACKSWTAAFMLLSLGCVGITVAGSSGLDEPAIGPAATGLCEQPVMLEPGVSSVHCVSPAIRMKPGQV